MSNLNDNGFDLKREMFDSNLIDLILSEINIYIEKSSFNNFTPFNQEVSKELLAKDRHQIRELYIEKTHKEAFFIKHNEKFKLINLMDPHNYIPSIKEIFNNNNLNLFLNTLNQNYKFKNSILFFKNNEDNNIIDWHRDSSLDETKKLIVGIYLDDSTAGIDAVKYIPGSHLEKEIVINTDKAVEVPAKKGDAVIHYGSVFHMSPNYKEKKLRRTLYLKYNLLN